MPTFGRTASYLVETIRESTTDLDSGSDTYISMDDDPIATALPPLSTHMYGMNPPRHINDLSNELLQHIIGYISSTKDLLTCMCVQKRWIVFAAMRLWHKPSIHSPHQLKSISEVLTKHEHPVLDYTVLVQRLSLAKVSQNIIELDCFNRCVNLQRLILTDCIYITDSEVVNLVSQLPRLECLDLQNTFTTDEALAALSTHCELQTLLLGSNQLTDEGIIAYGLRKGRFLRRMRISGSLMLTPGGVLTMALQCPSLLELDLSTMWSFVKDVSGDGKIGFTNNELVALLEHCPNMRELRLNGCYQLEKTVFDPWVEGPTIKRLDALRLLALSASESITDVTISRLVVAAPRLRHLNLSKCPLLTDLSVERIAYAYNSGLQYLHLGHCSKITDRGICKLVEMCPRLSFLDAGNCTKLTNVSLMQLATLRYLRRIGVVWCPNIDYDGVAALAASHRGVEVRPIERLHLSYCHSVPLEAIRVLLNGCPKIVHLSLTGIECFVDNEIQELRRDPPEGLSEHQKEMFCVFTGGAIGKLRVLLNRRARSNLMALQNLSISDTPSGPLEGSSMRAWTQP